MMKENSWSRDVQVIDYENKDQARDSKNKNWKINSEEKVGQVFCVFEPFMDGL